MSLKINFRAKSLLAPVVVLTIFFIVGVKNNFSFSQLSNTVALITEDLAPDTGISIDLYQKITEKVLHTKDYLNNGNEEDITRFKQTQAALDQELNQAYDSIQDPGRIEILNTIKNRSNEYSKIFYNEVVGNMQVRNDMVNNRLNIVGPETRTFLTQIRTTAFDDGDTTAGYFTGIALEHLMLARFYGYQYLVTNDNAIIPRVNSGLPHEITPK